MEKVFAASQGDLNTVGEQLTSALGEQARKVEAIARSVAASSGWKYQGIDLTPVPLKDISIGAAMESLLHNPIGSPGKPERCLYHHNSGQACARDASRL